MAITPTEELEANIEYMSEKLTEEGYYSMYSERKINSWREHMQNKFGGRWLEDVEEARVRSLSRQKFIDKTV